MTENDYENKLEAALDSFQQTAADLSSLKEDYQNAVQVPKEFSEIIQKSIAPLSQTANALEKLRSSTLAQLQTDNQKLADRTAELTETTTAAIAELRGAIDSDSKSISSDFHRDVNDVQKEIDRHATTLKNSMDTTTTALRDSMADATKSLTSEMKETVGTLQKELLQSRTVLEATFKNGVDQMLTPFRETCSAISGEIRDSNREVIGNFKTTQENFLDTNDNIRKTGEDCADLLRKFMEETAKYRDSLSKVDDSIQSVCATQMKLEKSQRRIHLFTLVNFLAILATIGFIFYLKKEGLV